jgi:hypothetical protein
MAGSKTYLNVPFAQKDVAKELGARWDAVKNKCYAPADKDNTLFSKWQSETVTENKASLTTTSSPRTRASSAKTSSSANNQSRCWCGVPFNGQGFCCL